VEQACGKVSVANHMLAERSFVQLNDLLYTPLFMWNQ